VEIEFEETRYFVKVQQRNEFQNHTKRGLGKLISGICLRMLLLERRFG